jgi:hypothetical protein
VSFHDQGFITTNIANLLTADCVVVFVMINIVNMI